MSFRGEVRRPYCTMMDGGVVLGYIICFIGRARAPKVPELGLGGAAAQPMKAHVHGLEAFAGNIIGDDAQGSGVVCLHGRWGLFVPHVFQGVAGGDGLAAIDVKGSQLRLCRGRHDVLDDLGNCQDGAIVRRVLGVAR